MKEFFYAFLNMLMITVVLIVLVLVANIPVFVCVITGNLWWFCLEFVFVPLASTIAQKIWFDH